MPLKIALVYRNPRITVAKEDVLFDELINIISFSYETISGGRQPTRHQMGNFGIPRTGWQDDASLQ